MYDPDGVNPYGRELAALLRERQPLLVVPADAQWMPSGVEARRLLPTNTVRPGLHRQAVALLRALIEVLILAIGGAEFVVVWTRSLAEELVFAILARLGVRVVLVVHNPGNRGRSGRRHRDWVRGWLIRSASVLVTHGPRLSETLRRECGRAPAVVEHLPYVEWLGEIDPRSGDRRVLIFGQLRPYKTTELAPEILSELPPDLRRGLTVAIAGRGELPKGLADALRALGCTVEDRSSSAFLADDDVRALFRGGAVLITQLEATQSGVAVLGLTARLPVVAFDAGDIAGLPGISVVPISDMKGAADALVSVLDRPPSAPSIVNDWRERCRNQWSAVLNRR